MQLDNDPSIKLSVACREYKQMTGDTIHVSSMHRWATRGLKGIRLRTEYAGGQRRTKRRWLQEFFDEVTAVANGSSAPRDPSCTETSVERELDAAGI
ncbi:DUF1580 domain-containing protein [Rhodopirellula sallentina]|uniref:Uncharacterized protein n=1 Tax=Rhodopirellula sallentina SM41 TaxID=1263870 RepID=M5U7K2_9BACT|nr:DUF1580 domain-containing protein [Rhodopirellula sallentina]EMI51933.1 hypothetical protein RSSM_06629 [Rhodopirellula sallentina SM41]